MMLMNVKIKNKKWGVKDCFVMNCEKAAEKHKKWDDKKIWWNGKKGITLHSLSGTNEFRTEAKDIEKLTIDKK